MCAGVRVGGGACVCVRLRVRIRVRVRVRARVHVHVGARVRVRVHVRVLVRVRARGRVPVLALHLEGYSSSVFTSSEGAFRARKTDIIPRAVPNLWPPTNHPEIKGLAWK